MTMLQAPRAFTLTVLLAALALLAAAGPDRAGGGQEDVVMRALVDELEYEML